MRKILLAFATVSFALTGACTTAGTIKTAGTVAAATADAAGVPAPVVQADKTTLDEKGAIAAETAFTVAAKGATLAIKTGLVTDPATIVKIGDLRAKAYAALGDVRKAYLAGNATSYSAAFTLLMSIIGDLNATF